MKATWLLCASMAALVATGSAHAQTANSGAAQTTTDPTAAATATPTGADQPTVGEGDIVVTAERRATSLQRTGVAATVLTGEDLVRKSINNVEQLQFASPSLTVNNTGQGNVFNIRGIGKGEVGSAISVGVVTYRDGVATLPGYFQLEPYYDIAGVEVLRGPQGTFAGSNATGGAVFITEQNPTFDRVGGYALAQYGNYNDVKLQGALNIPNSDTLAIRFAGNLERRDSFYNVSGPWTGNPGDRRDYSARIGIRWEPDSHVRVLLKGDYNNIEYGGLPASPAYFGTAAAPVTNTSDPLNVASNAYLAGHDVFGRVVGNLAYVFDSGLTLRSISGFQKGTTSVDIDNDATANVGTPTAPDSRAHNDITERIWSEEFNIVSPDTGRFTWVLGGYYQNDLITIPPGGLVATVSPHTLAPLNIDTTTTGTNPKTALAAFAQAGYKLFDGLQLTVGGRWSRTTSRNDAVASTPQIPGLVLAQHDFTANKRVNGKVALNWTIDPSNFIYAFVATGSKAGGLNGPNLVGAPPSAFNAEDVIDYEAGWKSTLLGGHLRTQLGGYYNSYKNFQVVIVDPRFPTISSVYNVPGRTKLYGAEFSAQGNFDALLVDVAASVSHSSLGAFYAEDARLGGGTAGCAIATGPAGGRCLAIGGNQQSYAPTFTFNAGAQYAIAFGSDYTLTPRVDYSHTGAVWATLFENPSLGDRLPARDIVNAQLTLATGPWSITGFATNLTDQRYVAAINGNRRYAGAPRQFGARVSRSF